MADTGTAGKSPFCRITPRAAPPLDRCASRGDLACIRRSGPYKRAAPQHKAIAPGRSKKHRANSLQDDHTQSAAGTRTQSRSADRFSRARWPVRYESNSVKVSKLSPLVAVSRHANHVRVQSETFLRAKPLSTRECSYLVPKGFFENGLHLPSPPGNGRWLRGTPEPNCPPDCAIRSRPV